MSAPNFGAATTMSAPMVTMDRLKAARLLSIMNAIAYGVNAAETFGYGPFSSGFTAEMDNATISSKYQTIITPHGIAFSIWGVIFIAELLCIVSTFVSEHNRTHPLMVDGVGSWFIAVCLTQTAWSPAFAREQIPLSLRIMAFILIGLVAIIVRQYNLVTGIIDEGGVITSSDYWLLQFPFEIHCSWITAALLLNMNILVVNLGGSAEIQAMVASASLAILALASFICLKILNRPQFVLPSVAAWALVSLKCRNDIIISCLKVDCCLQLSFILVFYEL
jgi:hypothetical protein